MLYGNESLKYSSPEAQRIASESILNFFERVQESSAGTKDELHSFVLIKNDCVIAEGCAKPLKMDRLHRIYSSAKGIVATAILFAVAEGRLSLDEKLVNILDDYVPEKVSDKMKRVTVYHLLTMNSGHDEDTCMQMFLSYNWIRPFMSIEPKYEPGTYFTYNNGIPHILAAIIKKKTGLDVNEYLKPRFLDVLGIEMHCRNNFLGEYEPSNVCMTQEGLVKIGYFFLKEGAWNGRRLLPAELCRELGKYHVPARGNRPGGYGFQVWRTPKGGGYYFCGGRDNHIIVLPEENMVFSCMANNESDSATYTGRYKAREYSVVDIFFEEIYDKMYSHPIKEDKAASEKLSCELANWNLAPKGSDISCIAREISGKTYVFKDNPLHIESVKLDFDENTNSLLVTGVREGTESKVMCGLGGEWPESRDMLLIEPDYTHGNFINSESNLNMASGAWTEKNELVIKVRSFSRMQSDIFYFKFIPDGLWLHISTVAPSKPGFPRDDSAGQYDLCARLAGT